MLRLAVAISAAAVLATACTDDRSAETASPAEAADEADATTSLTTQPPTTQPPASELTSSTTAPPPADIRTLGRAELLQRWADDRAAAVTRITENGWGVGGDNVLRGPADLRVDLDECPADWDDLGPTQGTNTIPLSWWEPYHGPGVDNAKVFLDWLGPDGYVDGRPVTLDAHSTYGERDPVEGSPYPGQIEPGSDNDLYNEELVAETAEQAFAAVGLRAWHENAGFEARFDRACLPSIGRRGSTDGWYQDRSPWSAAALEFQQVDVADAIARYAEDDLSGRRIGLLIMDNEYGETLAAPLLQLSEAGAVDLVAVRHDPAAPELAEPLDVLLATDPDIVIAATAGHPCLLALQGVDERRPDVDVLLPQFCDSVQAYLQPAGVAADGTLALRSFIEATTPPLADSALGALAEREYSAKPFSYTSTREWPIVWQTVQLLQIAAELPGGLTRSNVVLAAWSFDGHYPQMEGRATVTWQDKMRAVTAVRLYRYDSSTLEWQPTDTIVEPSGTIVEPSGATPDS